LDFLYESGLAVGKGSSEGFQALQQSAPGAAASSRAGDSSKVLPPPHSVLAFLELSVILTRNVLDIALNGTQVG
jgi:hypothetical protein